MWILQINVKLTMRIGEVILTGVSDIKNMSDTQSLDDMSVACVVPISQVQSAREYLVWIAVCCMTILLID